jgi:hypothetical protein
MVRALLDEAGRNGEWGRADMSTAVQAEMGELGVAANARVVDLCCGMGALSIAAQVMGMRAHKAGRLMKFKVSEVDVWVQSGKAVQEEAL